jgi:hypothetical protein
MSLKFWQKYEPIIRYPISVNGGKLSERFLEVLKLHVPPSKDKIILDPTCGNRSCSIIMHTYFLVFKKKCVKSGNSNP